MSEPTFCAACDKVCGELPDGWQITVELERDSGCVVLTNPAGDEVEYPSSFESITDQLFDALEYAVELASNIA